MIPSWRIGRSLRRQAGGWEAAPWQDARTLLARLRDRDAEPDI